MTATISYDAVPTILDGRAPYGRAAAGGRCRRRSRAFTVIEVVVTLAILAVLATIAVRTYGGYRDRTKLNDAATAIGTVSALIDQYRSERGSLPASLADVGAGSLRDPWGNAYEYVSHADTKGKGQWRKDHNIVPINSDYDLWSMGADGKSAPPLTASISRDDIVRANNGRFVGLASQYDP